MKNKTNLAKLCDLITQQVDPQANPKQLYIGLEHVSSARLLRSGGDLAAIVRSSKFAFKKDDVLYGKLRPYLDKSVLADADGVCTTELLVLRAKKGVNPRFLASIFHCSDFVDHAISGTTGSQHPRTSWSHIAKFELPEYSFSEQNIIAQVVWATHDALIACEKSIDSAEQLKSAMMRDLFSHGLRGEPQKETDIGPVPVSWDVVPFAFIREFLQYGTSTRCSTEEGKYPVLRIPNIESGRVNVEDLKYCDLPEAVASKYFLEKGDLLFIRTNGVLERLGSCAVYSGNPQRSLFASYIIRARLKPIINPRFISYFYGSKGGTALVAGRATPAADGKYNLNTGTIDALPLPLPPTLEEQGEIIDILDAIDRKISLHKKKRSVLNSLFRLILQKLIVGEIQVSDLELVPSDLVRQEASV